MKLSSRLVSPGSRTRTPALIVVCLLLAASVGLKAQPAPAAAPGAPGAGARGAGGRGGAANPVVPRVDTLTPFPVSMRGLLSIPQQKALDGLLQATAAQATAATAAKQALAAASLTIPANPSDLQAKAAALATAEQTLATALADKFIALQAGSDAIPASLRSPAVARLSGMGGRGGQAAPRSADDIVDFVSIFDGKTLNGWDGDPAFWRVENGVIRSESTPDNVVTRNTFLVWRGAVVKDFELKAEFRLSGTNSGIQYRSHEMPEVGKWVLSGYQADMDVANQYTGGMAEERGRHNSMVARGEMIRVGDDESYKLLGTLGDPNEISSSFVLNGWNTYHIIAQGNILIQIMNGRVSVIMIDEAKKARAMEGVIGLQMHQGPPFTIEYRNLFYRAL